MIHTCIHARCDGSIVKQRVYRLCFQDVMKLRDTMSNFESVWTTSILYNNFTFFFYKHYVQPMLDLCFKEIDFYLYRFSYVIIIVVFAGKEKRN